MDTKVRQRQILLWGSLCVIAFCCVFGFVMQLSKQADMDIGVTAVRLMYEFDDPEDLNDRYASLRRIVNDDAWEVLSIDDELRTVNTYFKFQYQSSSVNIRFHRKGLVLYSLVNNALSPDTIWAFEYDIVNGKISNVREYRWVSVYRGDKGGM